MPKSTSNVKKHCSICGTGGHNMTGCPLIKAAKAAGSMIKKKKK